MPTVAMCPRCPHAVKLTAIDPLPPIRDISFTGTKPFVLLLLHLLGLVTGKKALLGENYDWVCAVTDDTGGGG